MPGEHVPIFNLSAVVQETGVKPDTLRAWERRYGLPDPKRTDGGHRLYSQHDMDIVKWLVSQRRAGLGISKAVELWRKLETDGDSEHALEGDATSAPPPAQGEDSIADRRKSWISACQRFDEQSARRVLSEAFALFPVEDVCFGILLAGVAEMGRGWYEGVTTVQQEHFATEVATRQVESLLAAAPEPTRKGRILAVAPPQENHVFGLLLLTLLLRRSGLDAVHLGANVPVDHITDTIRNGDFQLVVSSAQQLHTAATLMHMAISLQKDGVPLAYGGRTFSMLPGIRRRIAGTYLGDRLQSAPQTVDRLLREKPATDKIDASSPDLQHALAHYRRRLPAINATVEAQLQSSDFTQTQLADANRSMGMEIAAALDLGDLSYLDSEIVWAEGLLHNHGLSAHLLNVYLGTYLDALDAYLGDHGQPIVQYFRHLI